MRDGRKSKLFSFGLFLTSILHWKPKEKKNSVLVLTFSKNYLRLTKQVWCVIIWIQLLTCFLRYGCNSLKKRLNITTKCIFICFA